MTTILRATLTALLLSIALPACGPPSLPGAESRYKANQDRLSAIVTRKPAAKAEVDAKVAEFKAEYDKAMKEGSDEQKIAALAGLSSRMDKYIEMLEPKETKAEDLETVSSNGLSYIVLCVIFISNNLAGPAPAGGVTPPAGGVTPPAPGKLDGPAPAGTIAPTPGSGGMGTPTPTPGTGMGTPTPAPTPAPATAPAGGGMGGM